MLKGYLKCDEIGRMLLYYINFELNRGEMTKVARHLRNCPLCMEKYAQLRARKNRLRKKLPAIEKKLRMQMEISSYLDSEASGDIEFIVEGMLCTDKNYKRELIECEEVRRLISEGIRKIKETKRPEESIRIIAKMKLKQRRKEKIFKNLSQFFQPLRRKFAKYV